MHSSAKQEPITIDEQIKKAATVALLLLAVGMFFSRFLQSISTVILSVLFLFSIQNLTLRKTFSAGYAIAFTGIFAVFALTYFNSDNKLIYWIAIKNKLPFLLLPFTYSAVKQIGENQFRLIRIVFICCCLITSGWTMYNYAINMNDYARLYAQGNVLPTIVHHVSFSILITMGVLFSFHAIKGETHKSLKIFYILSGSSLIVVLHILSVRTGIVLLYFSILIWAVYSILFNKNRAAGGIAIITIIAAAFLAYHEIPTFKSKVYYSLYGIQQYQSKRDTLNQVSDSRRFLSDRIGFEVFTAHMGTGTGIGDIQEEMNKIYRSKYPQFDKDVYSHIHNEYLYAYTGTGIFLGSLFIVFAVMPLVYFIRKRDLLFSILYFQLLLVMCWEPLIENQLGSSIYFFVCSFGILQKRK